MLTRSEARKLVEKDVPEDGAICYERSHWFGWVFAYQSKKYLETSDNSDMWYGTGPLLVNRFTGNLHSFGSSRPPSHFVWRYQLKWIDIFAGGLYLFALLISNIR